MAFLAKINDVSGGDITSIVSGTGLSGGATSGIVTLSVDAAQTGITSLGTQAADFKVGDGYGLVVGHSAQVAVAVGTSELQVLGTDQGESSLTLANWNATAGNMSHMNFLRGGGGSLAGSTIAPADAKLGSITWNTSDGSDYLSISAQIVAIADGTPGGNDTPGLLSFLTTVAGATGATERMRIGSAGSVYIGDTANAKMTQGLTINQAANDNEILALKSSDVAHGVTVFAETDTYGRHRKYDGATGGYGVSGFTEGAIGLDLMAVVTSENSTKSASGTGAIQIDGRLKASTSAGAMSANANILTVGSNGAIKFIVDVDGDTWQNGGATFNGTTTVDGVDVGKGMAKVWCHITAAGALGSGSFNVASITDSSVGRRVVVFDTDFSSVNSSCHATLRSVLDDNDATHAAAPAAGSCAVNHWRSSDGLKANTAFTDAANQFVAFGDQ